MSNETKRNVFNDLLEELADAYIALAGEGIGEELTNEDKQAYLKDYDAALPDDLPVIPKEVGEYLKRYKLMFTLFGFLRDAVSRIDTPLDDLNQTKYHWIANNQNTFARAWVLGVWRIVKTGEIVKLEAEK
ncbi:DUF1642 domain-containing protein [Lacticaseibacillus paracasei]|uniref:DUF1642 domain-containing protein n=1 Tax=Lacticaseibacillus paracasei TaxID=1597 RepID=UPI001F507520|nr:DUF1642 domain-containing protein [Lacticaseibacillus paracasei]MCI0372940.1 DUF1642 domain-containing protein [Lacticaseibacillus paracasei]MCI0374965.1 DUF1642 domain-containing protein [Lacticaseibacillus paracasei]